MGDLLNLNRFRKAKHRDEAEQEAERNRVRHGRSEEEKLRDKLERERSERALDVLERVRETGGEGAGGSEE